MTSRIFLSLLLLPAICWQSCSVKPEQKEKTAMAVTDSTNERSRGFMADCYKLRKQAFKMDSILLNQMEVDTASAKKAIGAFVDFATFCDADTMSPVFLIKAAQVARAINNIPQAKAALDQCIQAFPNFKDHPAALFLLAQLYDDNTYMNDEQKARELYQKIIDGYPRSPWASSAKGAILFLGKSDKQIMETLTKKKHG